MGGWVGGWVGGLLTLFLGGWVGGWVGYLDGIVGAAGKELGNICPLVPQAGVCLVQGLFLL